MNQRQKILSISGVLTYSLGILIGLALSGWSVWAEVEATLLVFPKDVPRISLNCPLMLSNHESGIVLVWLDNPTAETINPTTQMVISHPNLPRTETTVVPLKPGEKKLMEWTVGPDDTVFGGLILVNLFETSQSDFPAHQGSCGIPVSKLPGLTGKQVYILMFAASILAIFSGGILWGSGHPKMKESIRTVTNAGITLAVLVCAGVLLSLTQWWGLGLAIFLAALMLIAVILTQFVLFPSVPANRMK